MSVARIILASGSPTRSRLLAAAGVDFTVEPAGIDEEPLKRSFRAAGAETVDRAIECSLALAEEKAQLISSKRPEALVIGADQILVVGDKWFDKPPDLDHARVQLVALRGRTHTLTTAACVLCAGKRLWQGTSCPQLTMRVFSDGFLDTYLAREEAAVLGSVGAYRLEGLGAQLFSSIDGDHFAILGLPLIGLLGFLRRCGAVRS